MIRLYTMDDDTSSNMLEKKVQTRLYMRVVKGW